MNVRAIKTAAAESAINKIKSMTKREVKDVCLDVAPEFVEKRNYMQSDEFLKDKHNRRMLDLADDLFEYRSRVASDVAVLNDNEGDKFVQAINGFIRLKNDIQKNFNLNFESTPDVNTFSENEYRLVRNIQMYVSSANLK